MFRVRVPSHTLGSRLDSEHYDPVALDLQILLRSRKGLCRIGDIVNPRRQVTNGVRGPDLKESEYQLIRLQDCKEWEVDPSSCLTISREQFEANRRCRLAPGDVVVAIGGYLGNAAVVSSEVKAVIGQHSAILPFGHQTSNDPRYLVAFLNSRMGETQFRRWSRGSIQTGLNLEDVVDIEIPCPDGAVQSYIGGKVLQSERLKAWARKSLGMVLLDYESVGIRAVEHSSPHSRVSGTVLRDRIDAEHYPSDVAQTFRNIDESIIATLDEVSDIFSGSTLAEAEDQSSALQATVASLGTTFLNDRLRSVEAPRNQAKLLQNHDLAIAAAAHTASYIGKDITYCLVNANIYPSAEVMVIRPALGAVPSSWLWCFLKSQLGYRQIQACVRGITAHAYPDDIGQMRVQLPKDEVADLFYSHDDTMVLANNATKLAKALTNSARFLVEALIEGKVSEAELIAAGKDPDADRALLVRLRDDGLDGVGTRLFPDIDALFDLIAQVQGTGAESCVDP